MLASDDVLDVIGEERLRILRQTAVFAAITGPFADSLPEPLVHSGGMTFSQEPTSFGLQNGDEIPNTDQCLILVALLWRASVHLSASSSILPCISMSARKRSSDSALWRSRHCPTAARTRSKAVCAESAGIIRRIRSLAFRSSWQVALKSVDYNALSLIHSRNR